MALLPTPSTEVPSFLLVSHYAVGRIGEFPSVRVRFTECVYALGDPLAVSVAEAAGVLELPGVLALGLAGQTLIHADQTTIGVITAAEDVGTAPATSARVTLDRAVDPVLAGQDVYLLQRMPVGTPVYRRAKGGAEWEVLLDGADPAQMSYIASLMGGAYLTAVRAILDQLGNTVITDAELLGAIQALGMAGTNIDGLLAAQGERIELDRRAATLPAGVTIVGTLPV